MIINQHMTSLSYFYKTFFFLSKMRLNEMFCGCLLRTKCVLKQSSSPKCQKIKENTHVFFFLSFDSSSYTGYHWFRFYVYVEKVCSLFSTETLVNKYMFVKKQLISVLLCLNTAVVIQHLTRYLFLGMLLYVFMDYCKAFSM